ncbi:MAG: O-phosphoseryl-tRNA(Sec) selenium transferase [Candidatus Freyarchaeum deiterrae]
MKGLIPENMLERGIIVLESQLDPLRILFEQRKIPEEGWSDPQIKFLLTVLSMMDTDKDTQAARVGEREARVASPLVSELAADFCHGIGRSGEISAAQPKAPGASIMYNIVNTLASDSVRKFGAPNLKHALLLPLPTGMSIGLTISAMRQMRKAKGKYVVYPRIDHKSPLKAIELIGLEPKIIEGELEGDAVIVPPERVEEAIDEETVAILSTTTFFPPREPDDVKEIAKIAQEHDIPHVINNAYGVQSREIMKRIKSAIDAGRVDAVVQSTDKNFLTPIGGAIVASPKQETLDEISEQYAGRATAAPATQFLAAILALGIKNYEKLRNEQEENRGYLEENLKKIAGEYGERVLNVYNPIACAVSLSKRDPQKVGGALYNLRVTGPRALGPTDYGSCCKKYPTAYITMNAAIGSRREDIEKAVQKLEETLKQVR